MNTTYSFGAGGFKLGDRVEVLTTRQRGILISEVVHLSGCNSYRVLLPKVKGEYSDKPAIQNYDHLILRKLDPHEAVFGEKDDLTEETIFAPKGTDVNAEWIMGSSDAGKEPIPEIDDAVGVEDIVHQPGTEVWHKTYNVPMLVSWIYRNIYAKELEYGLTYMLCDKQVSVISPHYALIPMRTRISINLYDGGEANFEEGKRGPMFDDSQIEFGGGLSIDDVSRFAGEP